MSETPSPVQTMTSRPDHIFPNLTSAQIERIAAHGRVRAMQRGEVLVEQGASTVPFFVVKQGEIEIVRPHGSTETLITTHGPRQFSGEVNTLNGRRSMVRMRASQPGEVIELDRERVLSLVQTDSELSEILMRAFILRRVELEPAGCVCGGRCAGRQRETGGVSGGRRIDYDFVRAPGFARVGKRIEIGRENLKFRAVPTGLVKY